MILPPETVHFDSRRLLSARQCQSYFEHIRCAFDDTPIRLTIFAKLPILRSTCVPTAKHAIWQNPPIGGMLLAYDLRYEVEWSLYSAGRETSFPQFFWKVES